MFRADSAFFVSLPAVIQLNPASITTTNSTIPASGMIAASIEAKTDSKSWRVFGQGGVSH